MNNLNQNMDITVIGAGYVGLISAVCLCEFGFKVWLSDNNRYKIEQLKNGAYPDSEPGIDQSLKKHIAAGNLILSSDFTDLVKQSSAIVIAVVTGASKEDSNLSNLHEVVKDVALSLSKDRYTGIVIKTNLPVGACSIVSHNAKFLRPDLIPGKHYDIISNPGFLREGVAVHDFMEPSRVLIGLETDSPKAKELVFQIYEPLARAAVPFIFSSFETVELIRAATIGFVATKMAFINEIADFCDRCNADINMVIKGIALDQRIGSKALRVSPGFGGSSFPRTVRILSNTAKSLGMDLSIIDSALKSNSNRISSIKTKIMRLVTEDNTSDEKALKRIAILGLSFKPSTSDVWESASALVIEDLLKENNVEVATYDPLYKPGSVSIKRLPDFVKNHRNFSLVESAYEAVNQSDIAVIMTNWSEFTSLDFKKIKELMNKKSDSKPIILDYRNMFLKSEMSGMFRYISQGQ
ncbi:MAG: nucleotide sugar dehydrogenase [Holosporales bacterium]|jgi:UDPglucose 6-dehydrogenase|nr:nucleotide sugar dehydrogenase [Holosporales bacterium]